MNKNQISMQNRYFIRLILFVFILSAGPSLFSQSVGVNERGDSIVVFNDGSWRYYDSEIDSKKLDSQAEVNDPIARPIEVGTKNNAKKSNSKKVKNKKPKASKAKTSKKKTKKPPKMKNASKNKGAKINKKASKSKKKKPKKYTSKEKSKSKKRKPPRFTDDQSQNYAAKAKKAAINSQLRLRDYEEASFNLSLMEENLKAAYTSPNTTDADIVDLETKVRGLREVEENAKLDYELERERSDFYKKLISLPIEKRSKYLAKNRVDDSDQMDYPSRENVSEEFQDSEFTETEVDNFSESNFSTKEDFGQGQAMNAKLSTKDLKARQELRRTSNLDLYPPKKGCPEVSIGYNEFTGKKKTSLAFEEFFFNTPDQMRILLKKKEYLTCKGALSRAGNIHYLDLSILVASATAQRDYGFIEKGSRLTLKLLDGYSIVLFAVQSEQGVLNNLEKTVSYTPRYLIERGDLRLLEKTGIDKIRLVWMTGYEDYDIFNVDFLSNQIKCLSNN